MTLDSAGGADYGVVMTEQDRQAILELYRQRGSQTQREFAAQVGLTVNGLNWLLARERNNAKRREKRAGAKAARSNEVARLRAENARLREVIAKAKKILS